MEFRGRLTKWNTRGDHGASRGSRLSAWVGSKLPWRWMQQAASLHTARHGDLSLTGETGGLVGAGASVEIRDSSFYRSAGTVSFELLEISSFCGVYAAAVGGSRLGPDW